MALPSGTPQSGGSGLSRSEAAILAWKKRPRAKPKNGALDPKIAARVKEILAAKRKTPKGKAKGKSKDTRTKQEIANQNRAAVAKQGGMDKLEGVMVRLGAGMDSDLEKDAHDELISKGLAKRGADGKPKLTPAGRKWRSAADKGDTEAAGAALAEGRSGASESAAKETAKGAKKQEQATAKQAKQAEGAKKKQAVAQKQKQAQAQRAKLKQAAEKVRAEKEKAKGAAAKEKAARPAKEQAANRAKVAQEMADQDLGLAPSGSAALGDFADGKPLAEETAKQFEAMGLTEKDEAGNHRLTTEGRQAANAMSKGDTRAAIDAISRAGSKKKPKATKAMSDLAIKAGARHSRTDIQHLQSIHDSSVACGASCATESDGSGDVEDTDDDEGVKAIKGIMDNPQWYAQHECSDIMQAANALSTMAMLIQSELVEEDEDSKHVALLCDASRTLVKFISAELDELEGAAGDAADEARMGPMNKAVEIDDTFFAVKSIGEDEIMGPAIRYGTSDEPDMSDKRDYFTKSTNYYLDAWDKRPMLWHHAVPQVDLIDAMRKAGADPEEIKAMREAIIYLDQNPVIGTWTKAVADPASVWMNGVLDRAHRYRAAIKRMVDLGMLKISTDSIPQMVRREKQSNGTNEVKAWPIVAASLTPQAAEPRLFDVQAIKSIYAAAGMTFPFAIDEDTEAVNPPAIKADGREMADDERARAILLELELLELEMETA